MLVEVEVKSNVVKNFIAVLSIVRNKPTKYTELNNLFKLHILHYTGSKTSTCVWNKLAKKYCLGGHYDGKDGCELQGHHRVCSRKIGRWKHVWIDCDLFLELDRPSNQVITTSKTTNELDYEQIDKDLAQLVELAMNKPAPTSTEFPFDFTQPIYQTEYPTQPLPDLNMLFPPLSDLDLSLDWWYSLELEYFNPTIDQFVHLTESFSV